MDLATWKEYKNTEYHRIYRLAVYMRFWNKYGQKSVMRHIDWIKRILDNA